MSPIFHMKLALDKVQGLRLCVMHLEMCHVIYFTMGVVSICHSRAFYAAFIPLESIPNIFLKSTTQPTMT